MRPIITLTTDFGIDGSYAAAMKGVILSINADANIIDICHTVEPQNLRQASFITGTVQDLFPKHTIHVIVVDPEVGTSRRAVIVKTPTALYVAPDNGVLSHVLQSNGIVLESGAKRAYEVNLPPSIEAIHVDRSEYWRAPVSPTFHGRDIFAPVAANLSRGREPNKFGSKTGTLLVLPISTPSVKGGTITGHVQYIDRFGNVITDISRGNLPSSSSRVVVTAAGQTISGLAVTYAESEGLTALIGSTGYLEIALRNGNAAIFLKARVGDRVVAKIVSPKA